MRYFLISFNIQSVNSIGEILFEKETFPSHTYIEELVTEQRKIPTKIVVTNIYEFQSQEDYEAYKY